MIINNKSGARCDRKDRNSPKWPKFANKELSLDKKDEYNYRTQFLNNLNGNRGVLNGIIQG